MTSLILLPGAGMSASLWDRVRAALNTPSLAIDYPNRGNGAANTLLTLADYIAEAERQIAAHPADRYVVVGHSISGAIGLKLAERLGEKVAGFVAVSAMIPANGGSAASSLPPLQRWFVGTMMRLLGTRPPDGVIRAGLCNGLSAEDTERIVRGFTPEAIDIYTAPTALAPHVPSMYIRTALDKQLPLAMQDSCAARLHNARVETVQTGHMPMLAEPEKLAALLDTFAQTL